MNWTYDFWGVKMSPKLFKKKEKEGSILPFPKVEGVTKVDVKKFRETDLGYPKAWTLREDNKAYYLDFNQERFRKYYTNYYDVNLPYV